MGRPPLHLTSRLPTPGDFEAFFDAFFPALRDDGALRQAVAHEWRVLLESPTALSLVVEDVAPGGRRALVGCAQLAFVSEGFARWVRRGMHPWVNALATRPMPDGPWPLLTADEVRHARNGEGLFALLTRWARVPTLNDEERRRVGTFMDRVFQEQTQGYPYKELLIEAVGEQARRQCLRAGFEERSDYGDFFRANPLPPGRERPYLMGLTREEAAAKEGCLLAYFFDPLPPRLGLSPVQQEMLCLALRGESDGKIALCHRVTLSRVRKRWRAIYARVGKRMPEMLPEMLAGRDDEAEEIGRGPEKRRLLLNYLRDHPEELRLA